MISEREKVAATYEAQGRKEADTIAGETQEQVLALRGSATRERLRIEGESRAEASATKAVAFGQDPGFFRFIQSLELYQSAFQSNTAMYLSTESPLMEQLLYSGKATADETAQQDLKTLMESLDTGALDDAFINDAPEEEVPVPAPAKKVEEKQPEQEEGQGEPTPEVVPAAEGEPTE